MGEREIIRVLRINAEVARLRYELARGICLAGKKLDKLMAEVEFALWKATIPAAAQLS